MILVIKFVLLYSLFYRQSLYWHLNSFVMVHTFHPKYVNVAHFLFSSFYCFLADSCFYYLFQVFCERVLSFCWLLLRTDFKVSISASFSCSSEECVCV
jgi:hypothetical protein